MPARGGSNLNLKKWGFDDLGHVIDDWQPDQEPTRFTKDRRGFGHWVAQAMGVGAMLVLFNVVWPVAKTMMNTVATNMQTTSNTTLSLLNGLTVAGTGSTITVTFPSGYTPSTSTTDYTVTVNNTPDTVSSVSVSGQVATLTVSNAMNSSSAISLSYSSGSTSYTGSGTAT